jgi:hypothetical protein
VLDVNENAALIITEAIVELHWYHDNFVDITWADCDLRKYLNDEFYGQFSRGEKAKIITVTSGNPDNPWFKTKGGNDSADNIFLLSLEEVCAYFGDSGAKLRNKGHQKWSIDVSVL